MLALKISDYMDKGKFIYPEDTLHYKYDKKLYKCKLKKGSPAIYFKVVNQLYNDTQ